MKVSDIRGKFRELLKKREFVVDKTGVKTIEILAANFVADEPAIFGKVNREYVSREIDWYDSMSLDVNDIKPPVPKIWQDVASSTGGINSNYGYLVYSDENFNQFDNVVEELKRNRESRRAMMVYIRPSIWYEYQVDGMSDFICTTAQQYFIRGDELITHVTMRSQDVVFGYRNDLAWAVTVRDRLLSRLNDEGFVYLNPGRIDWTVGSLHVYERHFGLLENDDA